MSTDTSPDHCGGCNQPCPPNSFCDVGECVAVCPGGLTTCGAACADLASDRASCGECGRACAEDRDCMGGSCVCPSGTAACGDACVNTDADPNNCGICGRRCGPDEICNMGSCGCAGATRETACEDGQDDDCDQLVDCRDPDCAGATRPCNGACGAGIEACRGDGTWEACRGGDGSPEICGDGIDQDCDGTDPRNPDGWEPNDSCAACGMIEGDDPNGSLEARFDSVDDTEDCYRFQGNDSGTSYPEHVRVTLENIPAGHDYDIYLYVGQANCENRSPLASSTQTGSANESIDWTERFANSDTGVYFVRVVRFSGFSCDDDYRLTINGLR